MILNKYLKILSKDEYFDVNVDDDTIACIYLADNYNAKSFIWTIQDEISALQPLINIDNIQKKYPKTLIEALLKTPRMIIDDKIYNLILNANIRLLDDINKKDFLRYLGLCEWII